MGETMSEHKACYGSMFHDPLHFETNELMKGKVFEFEIDTLGLSRSNRAVKADISEWDDCLKCPEFDHCYKFCMAKLALSAAVTKS
jgi:hypothetical protein